jgi:hypothetical protein
VVVVVREDLNILAKSTPIPLAETIPHELVRVVIRRPQRMVTEAARLMVLPEPVAETAGPQPLRCRSELDKTRPQDRFTMPLTA